MKSNLSLSIGRKKYKQKILAAILSLIAGIILFMSLVNFQKKSLESSKICNVVVAKTDILPGQNIEVGQLNKYFELVKVNKDCVIEGFETMEQLEQFAGQKGGLLVKYKIKENEMIYEDKFICIDDKTKTYVNPVVVGVKVNSYEYCVGGTLRSGDIVDLSVINLDLETDFALENVLILNSFDVNGTEISANDLQAVSVGFNIVIEQSDYELYKKVLENGTIKLSKKI